MPKISPKIKSIDDLLRLDAEFIEQHKETKITEQENGIITIPIAKIRMFRNHPFRLYDGEWLDDMVESVKVNGVLIPAIVRKIESDENGCEYEILLVLDWRNMA
jgi:ParB family chromosome partitioning protein